MSNNLTHKGIMRGSDRRTPEGYHFTILLRETKNFWVDEHGVKYRKKTGTKVPRESFPMYYLDISSIKEIGSE